ncbi:MAG: nascent polypeptide-associated complex protein [Candidatus Aenigmarchaeota archaeon]|nr:nascent polypeptide-associated complex protein [Candidatus Aenigmarchaeota archaeon]
MFDLDPRKMQQMMKQLGMKMDNIPANQVIIKTDKGDITIEEPEVIKTTMKGQVMFQVSGHVKEHAFTDEDVKLVMEQSNIKDEEKATLALQETNGDVVKAIMKLKGE